MKVDEEKNRIKGFGENLLTLLRGNLLMEKH